jgi:thioredoxin reductase (NADPH)
MDRRKLVVIGGGPAGYTAAIYAARANLEPLCVEGYESGGMIMATDAVDNYPGFVDGVTGPELITLLRAQAERFGTAFLSKDITSIDLSVWPFTMNWTGGELEAESVIIATGATAKRLGLPSESALEGYGVAYCVACDGAFFADKRVAVVGGGDSAMDQAMALAKIAREVVIVHRRDEFRASEIMVDYARAHDNVTFLQPYVVEEILGTEEQRVTGLRLRNTLDAAIRTEQFDGVFVSVGHLPATGLFTPFLDHDSQGHLVLRSGTTMTSIEGVFAAGDVHDRAYRQVVTATGFGAMAAIDAGRWLAHRGGWQTPSAGAPNGQLSNPLMAPA